MKRLLTTVALIGSLLAPTMANATPTTDLLAAANYRVKFAIRTDVCGPGTQQAGIGRDQIKNNAADLKAYTDIDIGFMVEWTQGLDPKDTKATWAAFQKGQAEFCANWKKNNYK